jgi:uncharacterized protein RhaS with RHS repeats
VKRVAPTSQYAVPSAITAQGQTTAMSWYNFLGLQRETGPNGDQVSLSYDGYARPTSGFGRDGAYTEYTYGQTWSKATTNGKWVNTTTDGSGAC